MNFNSLTRMKNCCRETAI